MDNVDVRKIQDSEVEKFISESVEPILFGLNFMLGYDISECARGELNNKPYMLVNFNYYNATREEEMATLLLFNNNCKIRLGKGGFERYPSMSKAWTEVVENHFFDVNEVQDDFKGDNSIENLENPTKTIDNL